MTSLLTSCHIQHVCWHYKSVYFIVTYHRQRSTKLSTTYANVWTRTFWRVLDILHILSELGCIWHNFVKIGDNWIRIFNLAKIRTFNRCVKSRLAILNRLWKKWKNVRSRGGIFFDSHCRPLCPLRSYGSPLVPKKEQTPGTATEAKPSFNVDPCIAYCIAISLGATL